MLHRSKQLVAIIAAAVVTMLGVVVGAAPASAAASTCPDDYFCLYHWVDWQGGRWQFNHENLTSNSCWNLSNSSYTTGYNVNNTSASLVNNSNSDVYTRTIIFYDWINCNAAGASRTFNTGEFQLITNLNDIGWYHKFTSFKVVARTP